MKRFFLYSILALCASTALIAQTPRTEEFHKKYTLKSVAIFSRHNARSPITNGSSLLTQLTPHEWVKWSSAPSELTLKGGVWETANGQFFRKWVVSEGLFPENAQPDSTEVLFYANSKQRTIATARFFLSGFLPLSSLQVKWQGELGTHQPDFNLSQYNITPELRKQVQKELDQKYGKNGLKKLAEGVAPGMNLIAQVLDLDRSQAFNENKVKDFSDYNMQMPLNEGKEPSLTGSVGIACEASDALVLQYYETADSRLAAFGHNITLDQWREIAKVKDLQNALRFSVPSIYKPLAKVYLDIIFRELQNPDRKFFFMCGHDTNVVCLLNALEVEDYEVDNALEAHIPVGSKIVFEKWADAQGNEFIAINHVYQSLDQMLHNQVLDLANPPMIKPLRLKNLQPNQDNLYPLSSLIPKP